MNVYHVLKECLLYKMSRPLDEILDCSNLHYFAEVKQLFVKHQIHDIQIYNQTYVI